MPACVPLTAHSRKGGWELPGIVDNYLRKAAREMATELMPAEDLRIVGETAAWQALAEYRAGTGTLTGYMCAKALGRMRHYRRDHSGNRQGSGGCRWAKLEQLDEAALLGQVWAVDISERVTASADLNDVLAQLEQMERDLLWMHTGYEVTLTEIADKLGKSIWWACQKHKKALTKARNIARFTAWSAEMRQAVPIAA